MTHELKFDMAEEISKISVLSILAEIRDGLVKMFFFFSKCVSTHQVKLYLKKKQYVVRSISDLIKPKVAKMCLFGSKNTALWSKMVFNPLFVIVNSLGFVWYATAYGTGKKCKLSVFSIFAETHEDLIKFFPQNMSQLIK